MITLRVLGALDLRGASGEAIDGILSQPKRLAVFCYLVLARPRSFLRRDTLGALFWPEYDQERARTALRQTLYRLRHALGEELIQSRGAEEVCVARSALWCDALEFEQSAERDELDTAASLYRGDLLPGLFVDASPEFEQWLDLERTRFQEIARTVAWRLAERSLANGDAEDAVRWARDALSLSPADEQSLRRLIRLLDQLGDRAAAIRAYEDFARTLHTEYGLQPSAATLAAVAEIRGQQNPEVPVPPPRFASGAALSFVRRAAPRLHRRRTAAVLVILLLSLWADRHVGPVHRSLHGEARRAYMEGQYFASQLTQSALRRAVHSFETTVRVAPDYADAHVELGRAHMMLALAHGVTTSTQAVASARRAADVALELDPRSAAAHDLRALIAEYDWDWQEAEHHRARALQLDAKSATLWQNQAQFLNALGRKREAIAAIEKAHTLDPLSPIIRADAAVTYWMAGDHAEARLWASRALDLDSTFHPALWIAGEIDLISGDTMNGLRRIERAAAIAGTPGFRGLLGTAYARSGRLHEAQAIAEELAGGNEAAPWVALSEAMIWGWLGKTELAFEWLSRAVAQRDPNLPWSIKQYPGWDPLRADPRFAAVLGTVALP